MVFLKKEKKKRKREKKREKKEKLFKNNIFIYLYQVMVLYTCEKCNFNTDKKTNYDRHTKTKKHINNVKTTKGIREKKKEK